jgi:hypothetical protein
MLSFSSSLMCPEPGTEPVCVTARLLGNSNPHRGQSRMHRAAWAIPLAVMALAVPASAQSPGRAPVPGEAVLVPSAQGPPAAESEPLLDQIAGCLDSGTLNLEVDLLPGRVPATSVWTVEVIGTPKATIVASAAGGRVSSLDVSVAGGRLLVSGRGLRPKLFVESLRFEDGKGITQSRFRGRGIWRPIVAVFKGLARSALRKLQLRTDFPSVLHGDVLETVAPTPRDERSTPPLASSSPPPSGPSFLDVVREVHIRDSELTAAGGRPLAFGEMVSFRSASAPRSGTPLRLTITSGVFRPARGEQPAELDVAGRADGEIENGAVSFVGNRCAFSHGELKDLGFRVASGKDGTLETTISAAALTTELTSGDFHVPGGPRIGVEAPSHLAIRELRVRPDGRYSGIVDAELSGKAGGIERAGIAVALASVKLRTVGTRVADGQATGDVEMESEYRIDYPLVVSYPVKQVGERRVQLAFQGSFATQLHLENAGDVEAGTITGQYQFKVPWPPIEQAAFEVLRAKWTQDITAALHRVDFVIEPRRFGPCGGSCFLLDLNVSVEKKENKGRLFRQICDTEGKADLVVDPKQRRFVLTNVRIQPRCKGVAGWVVNFLGPLLTRTYTDITLFQMPEDLPFTIESVGSGADWVSIAGQVAWSPKTPSPSP